MKFRVSGRYWSQGQFRGKARHPHFSKEFPLGVHSMKVWTTHVTGHWDRPGALVRLASYQVRSIAHERLHVAAVHLTSRSRG